MNAFEGGSSDAPANTETTAPPTNDEFYYDEAPRQSRQQKDVPCLFERKNVMSCLESGSDCKWVMEALTQCQQRNNGKVSTTHVF
jgi:hypothetical protein